LFHPDQVKESQQIDDLDLLFQQQILFELDQLKNFDKFSVKGKQQHTKDRNNDFHQQ
jgi:hypothetical protein